MSKGTVARKRGPYVEKSQSASLLTCAWCNHVSRDREKGTVAGNSFTALPRAPRSKCKSMSRGGGREPTHVEGALGLTLLGLWVTSTRVAWRAASASFPALADPAFAPALPCGRLPPAPRGRHTSTFGHDPSRQPACRLETGPRCCNTRTVMDEAHLPSFHGRFTCAALISANGSRLHKSYTRKVRKSQFPHSLCGFSGSRLPSSSLGPAPVCYRVPCT